ncbi:MAG: S8 family serine peptidase [Pseudomonadota bacterium]
MNFSSLKANLQNKLHGSRSAARELNGVSPRRFALLGVLALPLALIGSTALAAKTVIEKKDDLPRHNYELTLPVTAYYEADNREELIDLARALRRDIEADLEAYDIRDDNTVQSFYAILGSVELLEEDWQGYLDQLEARRKLETKEANRLTMGLVGEAVARAQLAGDASAAAIAAQLRELLVPLAYSTVEASLETLKGRTEILSRALVLGSLDSNYQPIVDRNNGEVSFDVASSIVGASFTLDYFIPVASTVNEVVSETIAANRVEKADIWAARQIDLDAGEGQPVVLAVWDSGVDTAIFGDTAQLWSNAGEIPGNGIDDDDNGFVDDVHGIAYNIRGERTDSLLYPIGASGADADELSRMVKGLGDIQFNVDTPEASEVRQRMSALPQDEVKSFLESLSIYGNFSHGTHVAGIAAAGNPQARLLVTRMTYGHELIPETPTLAAAHRDAAMFLEVAEYFRSNGVRAVNMSWGGSLRGIEEALEANAAGGSPEERKALAREIYNVGDEALRRAISESPDILWITSAGNSDNDVRFDEFYPSSYEYANLLTVGAVDSAGDETSFTSLGKVDVYGNGFEVESYVPGGKRIAYNGTSMSSPQVMNLAGKLLARYPQLSVAELKSLIIEGSTEKALEARNIRLIDPAATLRLAEQQVD